MQCNIKRRFVTKKIKQVVFIGTRGIGIVAGSFCALYMLVL